MDVIGWNRRSKAWRAVVVVGGLLCGVPFRAMPVRAAVTVAPESFGSADTDLSEFRLEVLATKIATMPAGSDRDYFAGVLANRAGHVKDSIRLLQEALPQLRSAHPKRAATALEALADDYIKSFQYDDAARTYDDLLTHFASEQSSEDLQGTRDDAGLMHLLRGVPPQTITWRGQTRLKTERNPIGSVVTELTVNGLQGGVQGPWLLDTGANLSGVSRSFARKLGLKPLPGFGQTMAGITGIENPLQVAVLPTLEIGGATLHNVVLLILDDASLKVGIGKQQYQIDAILGYPVFQAMGAITFRHDGEFDAGDAARHSATGTPMYMKLLMPVIECGVEGRELPFSFDTGASGTNLSIRYYEQFRGEDKTWKKGTNESFGAGGTVRRPIYLQSRLDLAVGGRTATLKHVPIFTVTMGSDIDELYGNLGQDLVAGFESFTLDFSKMTFSLGAPLDRQHEH